MVWRPLSDINFSDVKQLLVGKEGQLGATSLTKKYRTLLKLQNKILKKCFFLKKIDKNVQLNYLFLRNS